MGDINQKNTEEDKKGMIEKVIEIIIKNKNVISSVGGGLVVSYPIINTVYKIFYQTRCEIFYGLPGKYFSSSIDTIIIYIGCMFLLVLIALIPLWINKHDEKASDYSRSNLFQSVVLSVCIGIELGIFNVFNLVEIIKCISKLNSEFTKVIDLIFRGYIYFLIILFSLFSILGITFIDGLSKIKCMFAHKIMSNIFIFSLVVSISIFVLGTIAVLSTSVEDKMKYEFVVLENKEYVVLSSYDNKILITPFEIDENGLYIFKTNHYLFKDPYEGKYEYRDIGNIPKIDKNN